MKKLIIQSKHYIMENKLRSNCGFYHILQNNTYVRTWKTLSNPNHFFM